MILGNLDKSDILGVYKPVLLEESDLLMAAVDEKHQDIVPETGKMLFGALEQVFGSNYFVVVIQQASLEPDFEKILPKLSMDQQ